MDLTVNRTRSITELGSKSHRLINHCLKFPNHLLTCLEIFQNTNKNLCIQFQLRI